MGNYYSTSTTDDIPEDDSHPTDDLDIIVNSFRLVDTVYSIFESIQNDINNNNNNNDQNYDNNNNDSEYEEVPDDIDPNFNNVEKLPVNNEHDEIAKDGDKTCVVCLINKNNYCIVPCGHQCICYKCSKHSSLKDCPICRVKIEKTIRVYNS